MTAYRSRGGRTCTEVRSRLVAALLAAPRHNAPALISETGLKMTTVYASLRRMVCEGWLLELSVPGTKRREYVVTPAGRRGMEFILALAAQSSAEEDSRSSSPTAARNSS